MEAARAHAGSVRAVRHRRALTIGRKILDQLLNLYAALALIYLLIPIAIIILFSFNDTKSRFNFVWQGFTLEHRKHPFDVPGLTEALQNSLKIAALSTVIATILGTMMALALVRYQFRGRGLTNLFIFLPLATPEVVLGASLLSLFITLRVATGFTTILIAHVMFNISFVVVTVRSRLIGFDRSLEEAAKDLGANGLQLGFTTLLIAHVMFCISFVVIVVRSRLIGFDRSLEEAAQDLGATPLETFRYVTFPLYIFGAAQRGIPVEVNVIAMILFSLTVAAMGFATWQQRRAEKMASVRPEQEGTLAIPAGAPAAT